MYNLDWFNLVFAISVCVFVRLCFIISVFPIWLHLTTLSHILQQNLGLKRTDVKFMGKVYCLTVMRYTAAPK